MTFYPLNIDILIYVSGMLRCEVASSMHTIIVVTGYGRIIKFQRIGNRK